MAKPFLDEFGDRIRVRRLLLGLSQRQLAERIGMHDTNVGAIERGERNVSLANILKLAYGLECAPGQLLDGLPLPQ
jgi:transcriptional regulator with XRE-family HTH domain